MSCSNEDLKQFADRAGRNATYTSTDTVFDFIEANGTWVEEFQLKLLHMAPFFSLMANKCTGITTIEELSVFCRWVEDGEPVEHFFWNFTFEEIRCLINLFISLIGWSRGIYKSASLLAWALMEW